jgi:hypothetical protein
VCPIIQRTSLPVGQPLAKVKTRNAIVATHVGDVDVLALERGEHE